MAGIEPPEQMKQRSRLRVIGEAAVVGAATGVAIGVVLAIWLAAINPELSARDALVLALYLCPLYAGFQVIGLGAAAVGLVLLGYRPAPRLFAALLVGIWVLMNGSLRHLSMVQPVSVTPHITIVGVIDAVAVVLATTLATLGIAATKRRLRLRALAVAVALLAGLELLHAWHERPLVRDVARDVPPAVAAAPTAPPAQAAESFSSARVVVLGLDGLSWDVLLPMLRRGDLPGFRALLAGAAYGNLATHPCTRSPLIWESIATGHLPAAHGIAHHVHFEFPGLSARLRHLPYFPLGRSPMALRRLLTHTAPYAPWKVVNADSTDAHKARIWEIAYRSGIGVGVYDWMNTTPASPVRPFLHGYGTVPPRFFPPDLEDGLPPLPEPTVGYRRGLAWIEEKIPYERTTYDRFRSLALRHHPELLIYYTHFGDAVNHLNWRDEAHGPRFFVSGLSHPALEPGAAVGAVMQVLDDIVADVLARTPEQATLVVLSDHGFDFRGYEHDNAPPGVLVLRGAGIRSGPFEGASIYDVAPTLLHLLGLPVAKDMHGTPVEVARSGGPLDRPVAWVESHGPALPPLTPGAPDPDNVRKYQEYLRALGYVN